jgi:tetratricopeptide (TPR) repeat protein
MIPIDPDNPIVRLCAEGMQLEQARRVDEARTMFDRAWNEARDDFEACIAEHFVARLESDPARSLAWNEEALKRANAVADDRVSGFMPSLYLNLGYAHERLGAMDQARAFYRRASDELGTLPPGPYAEVVRSGVQRGIERAGTDEPHRS